MNEKDSTMPIGENLLKTGQELYYVVNTLVPKQDGNRLLGPLTKQNLELKRRHYERFCVEHEIDVSEHPFVAYKLTRVE
jgi:hypothetical protein